MERFPAEFLYILVFLAIVLFSAVQAIRRRHQQAEEQAAERPPAEDEPLEDVWGRAPASAPAPAPAPVIVPSPPPPVVRAEPPAPRRLHPVRALLKDRRDLRRAVVLMMVLGPCVSQEPPERR